MGLSATRSLVLASALLAPLFAGCEAPVSEEPEGDTPELDLEDGDQPWDASEPDVPNGTVMDTTFTCGLMEGAFSAWFEKTEDGWDPIGDDAQPIMALRDCADGPDLDPVFDWEDDGSIYFTVGSTEHWLSPVASVDHWLGDASPAEPSAGCLSAIEGLGLELPVTLTMAVNEYVLP